MNHLEAIIIDESRPIAERWKAMQELEGNSAIDSEETDSAYQLAEIEECAATIRWENS
jgi:hypothetical protein